MFAIVETGGKQYRVAPNDKIIVEKISEKVGEKITLDKVLLVSNEGKTSLGEPFVEGAKVEVEVTKNFKDKKVIIFKKRRRQNSRRKNGHRQERSLVKVLSINS